MEACENELFDLKAELSVCETMTIKCLVYLKSLILCVLSDNSGKLNVAFDFGENLK